MRAQSTRRRRDNFPLGWLPRDSNRRSRDTARRLAISETFIVKLCPGRPRLVSEQDRERTGPFDCAAMLHPSFGVSNGVSRFFRNL